MVFEQAKWIWSSSDYCENEYNEFTEKILSKGEKVTFRISVCGDYTLFINGKYVDSNQYGDFPHYKVYDEFDITDFLVPGENKICILAWYFGKSGMRYYTPTPGVIFEAVSDDAVLFASNENTLSRKSNTYISGSEKRISPQLGYSFTYDATKEDLWLTKSAEGFKKSIALNDAGKLFKRPTQKLRLMPLVKGAIDDCTTSYIVDLGREIVGLPSFKITTNTSQKINVAYGENLENGHVKRIIGPRDFSFDYMAKQGENEFTSYMLRFAARFIEITSNEPIVIEYAGILPQYYPVVENEIPPLSKADKDIYEICLNTLKLCMMEHYVDCPWREQCLYAYDSRNQMLSGYIAFKDKNKDYARANLILMSKDARDDKLLSICFPSNENLVIPSFSLYYILSVKEYIENTGDLSLGYEVFDKLESLLDAFLDDTCDGLVKRKSGDNYWNFYDWSEYCVSDIGGNDKSPDCVINCIALIALKAYQFICQKLGKEMKFVGVPEKIISALRKRFYNKETGLFFINNPDEKPTELVNSLAVLTGVADGDIAKNICEKLARCELEQCSLSMKTFKYDAMLTVDKDKYKTAVLDEIRNTYKIMVDSGTGTVWETIEGASAFDNAGSLCHGWSAIPIYYFNILD